MDMSATPRRDAFAARLNAAMVPDKPAFAEWFRFAGELETELAAKTAECEALREALGLVAEVRDWLLEAAKPDERVQALMETFGIGTYKPLKEQIAAAYTEQADKLNRALAGRKEGA